MIDSYQCAFDYVHYMYIWDRSKYIESSFINGLLQGNLKKLTYT